MNGDDLLFPHDSDGAAASAPIPAEDEGLPPWKILVADDDPEVFDITTLVLNGVKYKKRPIRLLSAQSAREARGILERTRDIAVILLDVVMETENAGLDLVKAIRDELKNTELRIILRTGQPGQAPERDVIVDYDINDYRAKTELTSQKLFSATISALRAYEDITALEKSRRGLEKILEATADLFQKRSLKEFSTGVLEQLDGLLELQSDGILCVRAGDDMGEDCGTPYVMAGSGKFQSLEHAPLQGQIEKMLLETVTGVLETQQSLHNNTLTLFIHTPNNREIVIHMDRHRPLSDIEHRILDIFARKIAIGIDNLYLIEHLKNSHEATVSVLAALAEYKDTDTGSHILRVGAMSEKIARTLKDMGHYEDQLTELFLKQIGPASMLHDVGKVGIPDNILLKPGTLDGREREVMEKHAVHGRDILKRGSEAVDETSYLMMGAEIAITHHEHFDGNGYPHGLAGENIPLSGRIVAVADVFDALISRRPYKDPWPEHEAVAFIRERAGAQFDPVIIEAFLAVLEARRQTD